MDYEKEYKEALERAKAGKPLDEVFPELKEPEDERIRKELLEEIEFIIPHEDETDSEGLMLPSYRTRIDRYKAYLEKQKEQKPSPSIYWHAIKKGDTLPCRAYLWTQEYEKYYDCFEGRLIPNVENVTAGADMWYLPVDDIQTLPREGIDELPKEQEFTGRSIAKKNTDTALSLLVRLKEQDELRDLLEKPIEQQPAEWSEEDKKYLNLAINIVTSDFGENSPTVSFLKSLLNRQKPSNNWKPSEEQMEALEIACNLTDDAREHIMLSSLYEQLKSL